MEPIKGSRSSGSSGASFGASFAGFSWLNLSRRQWSFLLWIRQSSMEWNNRTAFAQEVLAVASVEKRSLRPT